MQGKKIALALILLLFTTACLAAEIENTDNVQSVKVKVVVEGSGRIEGNLLGQDVEIEVLSFPETANQRMLSLNESFEINGKSIPGESKLDKWGNNYALFKVNETGSFNYTIEAVVETNVLFPDLQEYDLATKITEGQEFLNPSENIESNSEAIRTAALNLFESESWLNTVVGVTAWTYESIEYDLGYYPETHSATTTLRTKKGVCDEFAVLGAAMLRAKGIPTKIVTGLAYNPEEEQGWNNHAWLETLNPGSGWVSLDPTFGQAGTVD
jgi:transglutaminase/protease-like cytokinesis protein 3